ncbi:hypothetical protein [Burkholderia cepacia]|uniref:hypothetical protein n=1 Tax=Burkholderia cepacia TaxID=292 RepID=UPI00069DF4DB|nr:hypothetical protein [Burkholderia cepacia]
MNQIDVAGAFLVRIGTERPIWTLTDDSNAIVLGAEPRRVSLAVDLGDAAAARVRGLGGVVASVQCEIVFFGTRFDVYLVGKKIDDRVWRGVVSPDPKFIPADSTIASWDTRAQDNVVKLPRRRSIAASSVEQR